MPIYCFLVVDQVLHLLFFLEGVLALDQLNLRLLFIVIIIGLWTFLLSSYLFHLICESLTNSSMYCLLYYLTLPMIERRTWTFIVLLFYSIFNFYNIKLTLIVCKIFQFLYKVFYGSFSWFCEKDKRKVILFQSSSIHCDIAGRSFSVLKLLLILLRNSLGKSAVT